MDLINAMRVQYSKSKRTYKWVFIVSAVLYFVAAISILRLSGWLAVSLGITAAVAQIALFILRQIGSYRFNIGEQVRRAAMLQDGLGVKLSEIQIANLRERVGRQHMVEPDYLGPYYESGLSPGPKRLLEITAESAFFTSALSRSSAQLFGTVSLVGIVVVIISLVVVIQSGVAQSALDAIATIAVASMLFWATGDLASAALRFHSLSKAASSVLDRCDNSLRQNKELTVEEAVIAEAVIALDEYNCSALQAPPIPTIVYKWRQNILNEAWRKRKDESITTPDWKTR